MQHAVCKLMLSGTYEFFERNISLATGRVQLWMFVWPTYESYNMLWYWLHNCRAAISFSPLSISGRHGKLFPESLPKRGLLGSPIGFPWDFHIVSYGFLELKSTRSWRRWALWNVNWLRSINNKKPPGEVPQTDTVIVWGKGLKAVVIVMCYIYPCVVFLFAYMWLECMVDAGKYAIHGAYGIYDLYMMSLLFGYCTYINIMLGLKC